MAALCLHCCGNTLVYTRPVKCFSAPTSAQCLLKFKQFSPSEKPINGTKVSGKMLKVKEKQENNLDFKENVDEKLVDFQLCYNKGCTWKL